MSLHKPCRYALAELLDAKNKMFIAKYSNDHYILNRAVSRYEEKFNKMLKDFGPEILKEALWQCQQKHGERPWNIGKNVSRPRLAPLTRHLTKKLSRAFKCAKNRLQECHKGVRNIASNITGTFS